MPPSWHVGHLGERPAPCNSPHALLSGTALRSWLAFWGQLTYFGFFVLTLLNSETTMDATWLLADVSRVAKVQLAPRRAIVDQPVRRIDNRSLSHW